MNLVPKNTPRPLLDILLSKGWVISSKPDVSLIFKVAGGQPTTTEINNLALSLVRGESKSAALTIVGLGASKHIEDQIVEECTDHLFLNPIRNTSQYTRLSDLVRSWIPRTI